MDDQTNQPMTKTQRRELRRQEILNRRQGQGKKSRAMTWIVSIGIVIVVGGLIVWAVMGASGPGTQVTGASDVPVLGSATAKVVVMEFSDISCPACATAAPIVRQLGDFYQDKIKIEFRSFNIGHQWSEKSLEASRCALAQGKFWEYADKAFAAQSAWETAGNAVDLFKSYAKDLSLNTDQFNACLDSGQTASAIQDDMKLGRNKGVNSTPTFIINDQKVVGVQTLDEFKKVIDAELAKNN
ncbi:MAG: thioredoxin domain-containing protein [Patescibacteria group bacterium]|jgi:protein-disulfide isomerase